MRTRLAAVGGMARLPLAEQLLTVVLGGAYLVAEVAIRTVGFRRTAALLQLPIDSGPPPTVVPPSASALGLSRADVMTISCARRLSRHVHGAARGCLRRSLVLGWLLRRHDPRIRFGVARAGTGYATHAWIEISGVPVDDPQGFAAFDRSVPVV